MAAARRRWATRAEPPGALGRLEDLAVQLAGVTGLCPPPVPTSPAVAVFAGDHGVVSDGASAWPSAVTAAMVETMSAGGAAVCVLAAGIGASVTVVDVGVASPLDHLENVRHERVRPGTASIVRGPAMTAAEAAAAVEVGIRIAGELVDSGADCLIGGDMGIGNTTAAAAIIGAACGRSAEAVTGAGAGLPARGPEHKRRLVAAAMQRAEGCADPLELLAQLGGLEIAALAGFYVAAAGRRTPFIVDGAIAAAALCVADLLSAEVASHAIAGHLSAEPAAGIALEHLGLRPLVDLDLRLGEGTGACLAFPLVKAAAAALEQMAELPTARPAP
ncbi:MAG: nicotinate-nucleotide--dimethylbenzimidazole phosphoribosyltransferase [Acidimicrobiia bacterium]|nr:nicotinate-nucleotide--dimethylbenzimidazole phosphoribosyltransferase [Acidimicrobiia bacterium]